MLNYLLKGVELLLPVYTGNLFDPLYYVIRLLGVELLLPVYTGNLFGPLYCVGRWLGVELAEYLPPWGVVPKPKKNLNFWSVSYAWTFYEWLV